jgi:hypothetical protein
MGVAKTYDFDTQVNFFINHLTLSRQSDENDGGTADESTKQRYMRG